ncbi:unnamed protein product, partial [Mycena citricolor]
RWKYALGRKAAFVRKVLKSRAGEVVFDKGDLVQVFRNNLADTVSNKRKLTSWWSELHRVEERILNFYQLKTIEGVQIEGRYNARRLSGEPLLLSDHHGILHVTVHVPSVRRHMLWSGLPCQAQPHDTPARTPIVPTVRLPLFSLIWPLIVPWPHCLALPLCLVIHCSVGYI